MEMQVKMEKKTIEDDVATENVNVELPQIANPIEKPKEKKKKKEHTTVNLQIIQRPLWRI